MGPSGAGKTTLLNALSHRLISVTVTGERLLNGKPYGAALLNDMSGYVMQVRFCCGGLWGGGGGLRCRVVSGAAL